MPVRRLRARALLSTIACLALAAGLSQVTTGPASAAPAVPTNLTSDGAAIPTLSWDRVDSATKYVVQGSENSSFSPTIFNVQTVNNSYVPVRVLKEGTLYWRVQAVDGSGSSAFAEANVPVGTLVPPTGLAITPSTGPKILPPAAPPVIHWDAVQGATSYDVEVDAEGDGVGGTVKTGIKTTTYVWPDPQGVGEQTLPENFFARVRAHFANNLQTDWTDYVSYDVNQLDPVTAASCQPGEICAPDPNSAPGVRPSVSVHDVVFSWDPVKGAKQYEIWVARDHDFNNQVEKKTVVGTRYSPTTTYDNGSYFWKVRPINAAGQPAPWPTEPSQFTRVWPDKPAAVWPPDSTTPVGDDFYYQWTPVPHASKYQLDVGTDPNFTPNTYDSCFTAQTTYTAGYKGLDKCMPNQGQLTYWRVRAIDDPLGVEGIYSDANAAMPDNQAYKVVYSSGVVNRLSPANGDLNVAVPTFRWSPSQDAQRYEVDVYDKNGNHADGVTTSALSWTPEDTLDPAEGPFSWSVAAIDADGHPSPVNTSWTFNVGAPPASGPVPVPTTATEQVTSRFPQLSWTPVTGASYYRLRVSETPGFTLPESTTNVLGRRLENPSVTDDGSYFLRPGTYTWWIDAFDVDDHLLISGPAATFAITAPDVVGGRGLALDGRAVDAHTWCAAQLANGGALCDNVPATPVLDWDPVPGAGGYLVYLAEDNAFTNRVQDPYAVTENSRWTPTTAELTALADNQANQSYYWFVRPCAAVRPLINCGPDPVSQPGAATNAFKKLSPKVVQTAPVDQSTQAGTLVTFSWQDYRTTNAGVTYAGGDAASHQSAQRYRLQVSQSATISDANAIDDVTVDQTTYTAFGSTYPEGDLWWRVQAIDAKGNRLAWSDTRKFTKQTPATVLNPTDGVVDPGAFPAYNSHVSSGEFPFRWTSNDYDVTWKLEVYKDDDVTLSAGKRVLQTTVKQAAFVPPASLPPSTLPYRWRIMRYDATGSENRGRWSGLGRFWVDPAPVNLDSPASGSLLPPNGVLLKWHPYAAGGLQATSYSVDIRNASNQSVGSVSSTAANAWAPTVNYPDGTYTWVVTAFDASGNTMGTSPAWTFQVDTALNADAQAVQIQAPDGTEVGKTLTSTPPTWNHPGVQDHYQWQRNGSNISGATSPTYTTTAADAGKSITLKDTGTLPGYADGVSTSNAITVTLGAAPAATVLPTISGVPNAKETLTATPGTWPGSPKFTYQWFVNGSAVANQTKSTYVVRTRDAGLPVYVRVTATQDGLNPGVAQSAALAINKLTSETTATVAKKKITQRQRAVLTVNVALIDFGVTLGQVQVKDGSKVIAVAGLQTGSGGKLVLRLKKLKKGKHKLTVTYLGSVSTLPSTARTVTVKVIKPKKK
ncbi:MAG TPA: Ig-like domain repeat protein [Nocardioides sp.]|uniref:Ig-like domain repeat protein n=1 Tax=Nocardioides sp. TaxID=35761 RepID=UPI002E381EF8|nr:Ig-like domain repeat protein [Nocardioides sp.]HEX5089726.1 Ig-like domain repeat protein [Nocardioides sp.]